MKKKTLFIQLLLLLAGFFIYPCFCLAGVKINEIAWMGTTDSANSEWIELYNENDFAVDLSGWTLAATDGAPFINLTGTIAAGDFFILERTNDATLPTITANQIYTGALGNSGEVLELKDSNNNLIDRVNAEFGWPAGNNATKQTMSRDGSDWKNSATALGTPGATNNFETSAQKEPPLIETPKNNVIEEVDSNQEKILFSCRPGDIVINEFVSDPEEGDEWVELYNKTSDTIDLKNWYLEEGSESKTIITGIVAGHKFFIIEKPKGNLNNAGDIIILKNNNDQIIDQVVYGDWQDNDLADNAPVASDPNSVARITDGYDTDNDGVDFKVTSTPTKGSANIITGEKSPTAKNAIVGQYSQSIIINEVFPNPVGADDDEFIEIKNIGNNAVDLNGWKIGDASTKLFTIKDLKIEPGEILFFPKSQTKINLNNSGTETVTIYWPNKIATNTIEYSGQAPEGESFCRDEDGNWHWSTEVTAGLENIIIRPNEPPIATIYAPKYALLGEIIVFDASDSADPEDGELKYFWNFGDGRKDSGRIVRQIYTNQGEFTITLKVIDDKNASTTAQHIVTVSKNGLTENTPKILAASFSPIFISEFLPNPVGADATGEFIELFNPNDFAINMARWRLDDEEGGSAPYIFPANCVIEPFGYLLLPRTETGIALNNNGDEVRLFDPENNIVDSLVYKNSIEGVSFIRDEFGQLLQTKTPTPGEVNSLTLAQQTKFNESIFTTIDEIYDEELNSPITAQGVVLVEPGILGSQIFYIENEGAIQVYMFKKDFPNIKAGDKIEVSGTLTQSRGEKRIKIQNKENIKILNSNLLLKPKKLSINQLEYDTTGLITIEGEVTEIKGYGFYIDDGTDELYAYLKSTAGIEKKFKVNDHVLITGILITDQDGLRLLPRYQNDITVTKILGAETEKSKTSSGNLPLPLSSNNMIRYLLATIITLLIINLNLFLKNKKIAVPPK